MSVKVDESRQDVMSFELENPISGTGFGTSLRLDSYTGVAHALDSSNTVLLDDDIDGPDGRGPRTIDERDAAKDEPIEGAFALGSGWSLWDRLGLHESGHANK
jgi:hypothetical protein